MPKKLREIRARSLSWKDYGMSKNLQDELKAFCLQYDEKKHRLVQIFREDGVWKESSKGESGELIEERQISEKVRLEHDCEIIEEAAELASTELAPYLLKSVTKDLAYEFLEFDEELGRILVGKTDFYGYRRRFFYYLQKIKTGDRQNVRL